MEDKILIKSQIDKKLKDFLTKGPLIFLGIAAFCAILLTVIKVEKEYTGYYYYSWKTYTYTRTYSGWKLAFWFDADYLYCSILFLLGCITLLGGIITGIIYLVNRKSELYITENNVKGKTLFGKEVVLPLYMISAYSTRKFLSTVTISTASGITKFPLIANYIEIGNVLSQKINDRQNKTANSVRDDQPNRDSLDQLMKLKSLLDAGVITQEEFDEKKKQLLEL